ncbi:fimbrial chaperone [Salmonella enterica]|uniref:Fimbrial chaperone n=2 Tax=Salmonella enterica TaxID=28901 RepID=A0A701YT70_SALER|nr:fimbrial chaperone [Salmonella enterica]HAC6563707.1 fimbrial chaperone [Salmonella enterica subsp. indica]HBC0158807.1 fimbrial chaperone [Salmonella enterica subsp. indica]HCM1933424.1 fimbrial chaperone [Salmonella enterica subsp. indica serovar 6,7:z41:1,7]
MTRMRHLNHCLLCVLSMVFCSQASADIVLSGTRIIYKESQKDASIRMENKGARPLLVQNWLDNGKDNEDPSTIKVPFTVTPPVSRIDAKRGQTVKFTYTGSIALPKDRESVFWFNALEIPPKPSEADAKGKNLLQLAFRTRIKLFYRPEGLAETSSKAPEKLTWQAKKVASGAVVHVTNPSPYFVSFSSITLESAGKKYEVAATMVAPKSSADFPIKGLNTPPPSARLEYHAISDFGGDISGNASL